MDWKTEKETWSDPDCKLFFVKGVPSHILYTHDSSNSAQVIFLERVLDKLQEFVEGIMVLGGGLNLSLDPRIDSTGGTSHLSFAALHRIKKCLFDYQLIDVWRSLTPTGRDYTHFSPPHGTYSRINLILTKHHDLANLTT